MRHPMFERLFNYLEERPRAVVSFTLTFLLGISAVAGLCIYVLTIVVEGELRSAQSAIKLHENLNEQRLELVGERAKIRTEKFTHLVESFIPVLEEQRKDLGILKRTLNLNTGENNSALTLYKKLSELEYSLSRLEDSLRNELRFSNTTPVTATVLGYGPNNFESYLIRWILRWVIVVACICALLLLLVLKLWPKKAQLTDH